jgi:hypothetical protein
MRRGRAHRQGRPDRLRQAPRARLEATLFSETVRDASRIDYLLMPRLLAVAERAWAPDPGLGHWKRIRPGRPRCTAAAPGRAS